MNIVSKDDRADVATVEQQIEQHAQNIERIQNGAAFEIGRELKQAQDLFKFKRDEGGFTGWLATRLPNINQRAAYRCIQRYEGIGEFDELVKLSNEAQLQAAGADPDIKAIIAERVEAGEIFTAAQRAMATAFIYPASEEKGGRGKKAEQNRSETKQFSKARLSYARAVLAHSRPIAQAVLAGSQPVKGPPVQRGFLSREFDWNGRSVSPLGCNSVRL